MSWQEFVLWWTPIVVWPFVATAGIFVTGAVALEWIRRH